ncbi:MAG TPA: class I SAM-dependent methyltransferase [Vicinamibacterales bacterium]
MPACCSTFERAAEQQFNEKKAAAELKRYRTKGPGPTTRLLQEGIARAGAMNGTLLDVGSGVGSLTFGLLERGITHAIAVDASSAYNAVARQEAERLGRAGAVQFMHGDFVTVVSELPVAALVTLDRVVCCYPSYGPLLDAAIRHADRCLALSYPRDVWYVRLGVRLENGQRRLTNNSFRTFVHPVVSMEQMIRAGGFDLSSRRETWMWSIDVYLRQPITMRGARSTT